MAEVRQFRAGATDLVHPRPLAVALLLGAVYVTLAGAALYLIVRGLGIRGVSLWQVLAVSYFSLGFSLIVPLRSCPSRWTSAWSRSARSGPSWRWG